MRGRPPKSRTTKRLAGNPGKRKLGEDPAFSSMMPTCPAHLTAEAKREWDRLATELHRLGLLTIADRTAFAAYCQSWADWVHAVKMVQSEGPVCKSDKGNSYLNPWSMAASKALDLMNKFGAQFGLTPGSRARVPKSEPPDEDPFESFLKNGKGK